MTSFFSAAVKAVDSIAELLDKAGKHGDMDDISLLVEAGDMVLSFISRAGYNRLRGDLSKKLDIAAMNASESCRERSAGED